MMNRRTTPPPRSRSQTPLVLALVVGVVAAFALAAVLVTSGGDDDDDDGPTGTTGEPIGGALAPYDPAVDDSAVGRPAPALSGANYAGDAVTVRPGTDGPLMLVFLAHWCPHCNREIPVLNQWRDAGGVPEELRVVGISTAVSADRPNYPPGEWLVDMDWQWDVIADEPAPSDDEAPPAMAAYGVTGFPFFVLIDAEGNVTARGSGEYPIEALEPLVAATVG